jgi:hypothetical protein
MSPEVFTKFYLMLRRGKWKFTRIAPPRKNSKKI